MEAANDKKDAQAKHQNVTKAKSALPQATDIDDLTAGLSNLGLQAMVTVTDSKVEAPEKKSHSSETTCADAASIVESLQVLGTLAGAMPEEDLKREEAEQLELLAKHKASCAVCGQGKACATKKVGSETPPSANADCVDAAEILESLRVLESLQGEMTEDSLLAEKNEQLGLLAAHVNSCSLCNGTPAAPPTREDAVDDDLVASIQAIALSAPAQPAVVSKPTQPSKATEETKARAVRKPMAVDSSDSDDDDADDDGGSYCGSLADEWSDEENVPSSAATMQPVIKEAVFKPLRDYQSVAVDQIMRHFKERQSSVLLYLPTGGGKTRVAIEIMHQHFKAGLNSMFVVNRRALIPQTQRALSQIGLGSKVAVICAEYPENRECPIQIASVQTLRARGQGSYPPADLVIIDEQERSARILGLSATPMRTNGQESLGWVFNAMVNGPSVSELVRRGVLVQPQVFGVDRAFADRILLSVRAMKGDFSVAGAAKAMAAKSVMDDMVRLWKQHAAGKKTICFAVNVAHSKAVAAAFLKAGVPAAHVDGTTPHKAREKLYSSLRSGSLLVLSSVNTITEGFDEPSVEAILLLRPTQSKALYIQQVGRGLRCAPGKSRCVIIDCAGNTWFHGPVTGPADYDIETNKCILSRATTKSNNQPLAAQQCAIATGGCGMLFHASERTCPSCGKLARQLSYREAALALSDSEEEDDGAHRRDRRK